MAFFGYSLGTSKVDVYGVAIVFDLSSSSEQGFRVVRAKLDENWFVFWTGMEVLFYVSMVFNCHSEID